MITDFFSSNEYLIAISKDHVYLYKTKISTELKDRLLLSAKNQKIPNNKNLAGRIGNEKLFDLLPFNEIARDQLLKNHEYE